MLLIAMKLYGPLPQPLSNPPEVLTVAEALEILQRNGLSRARALKALDEGALVEHGLVSVPRRMIDRLVGTRITLRNMGLE